MKVVVIIVIVGTCEIIGTTAAVASILGVIAGTTGTIRDIYFGATATTPSHHVVF